MKIDSWALFRLRFKTDSPQLDGNSYLGCFGPSFSSMGKSENVSSIFIYGSGTDKTHVM